MEEKTQEKGDTLAVYEVSYLLLPSLAMEQVPAKATDIKDMLTSAGGTVISLETPVSLDLAYPMTKVVGTTRHKCTSAYFGWVKFEMSREGIEVVKKALDANVDILRYIIIKTVRENTLLNGKMMLKKEEAKRSDDSYETEGVVEDVSEVEADKEVAPEELDKSIDDLVIA
ncbi:MAG: 30S ribosomal protein S6 [Nitrospira sp.]